MAMDFNNVSPNTQEQLMEDAKAKAKARYDKKLLEEQEEQIRNLLLLNNLQDPRNQRVEMKPRKEYSHFEDNLPSGEDLMALMNDPNAVKVLAESYRSKAKPKADEPSIVSESKEDNKTFIDPLSQYDRKIQSEVNMDNYIPGNPGYGRALFAEQSMKGYTPSRASDAAPMTVIKNSEGIDRGGSVAPSEFKSFSNNDAIEIPEELKNLPELNKQTVEERNWYLKQLTPKIDEALKAIADKDPSMLQLPEVQELLKRSKTGYDKQRALSAVAAFTSNPQLWMSQANAFRDEGDKNLMDAAQNLETIRNRQLEATKAVADNLTSQKSILGNLHGQVLGLEGNLAQVSIPSIQQANDLELQADAVHEQGDAAINSAIQNMQNFVQRLGDMGVKPKDVAVLMQQADGLNASNIRDFIRTVNGFKPNTPMRKEFNERLNAISNAVAQYETAMIQSKKMKEQAQFHKDKAEGLMTAASNLGGKYRVPEWMSAPAMVQAAPAANNLSTPFSDEKSDVPSNEVQPREEHPMEEAYGGMKPKSTKATPTPAAPTPVDTSTVTEPWYSIKSIQNLSTKELDNLFDALYKADTGKAVKGAKVGIYQTEKGAEGNAVGARRELEVAKIAQDTDRFLNTLGAWANNNSRGISAKLNKLKNLDALNYFKSKTKEGTVLYQLLDNATNEDIRKKPTSFNFADQDAQIASLLMQLGYV
jgi:hypothetical protein